VKEDAARRLGWLVCAGRPLKWHEIQEAISINLKTQDVDFDDMKIAGGLERYLWLCS
jgi:hypothetical protein